MKVHELIFFRHFRIYQVAKKGRLTVNPSFLASFEVSFVKSRLTVMVFREEASPSKSKAIF